MVNISKKKLSGDVFNKINNRLIETIYNLNTKNSVNQFFNEILSYPEKVILAKRFSIIFMLHEEMSWYRIHKILNVSIATVRKVSTKIELEEYKNILKIVKRKKNRKTFWTEMDIVLKMGMPPIVGKGRWKFLDELYEKYDIKEELD
ncbi:MAG: Trp family transcriptional regulator [Patescibacteria group bacterium]|nr:Trp family transcriptional regulator [Patescibacteria group bacterium]